MPAEQGCRGVRARLTEALLAHREPASADLAHAAACPDCGLHRADLLALSAALDSEPVPEPRPELAAAVRARAIEELARPVPAAWLAGARRELPPGYRRELLQILFWAAAPLPLVVLWYALLFDLGGSLLAGFLPGFAVGAIGFAFAAGTLSWLALIYGSIPFVAHYRASRRWREVAE